LTTRDRLLIFPVCAAVDQLCPIRRITAEAIRHGYIAYLVRQGLRLSDLEQIAALSLGFGVE
jgi:hypothetical protein